MSQLIEVDLDKIDVPDIRVSSILDEEQRAFIDSTVKEIGTVQDIVVRPGKNDRYVLVAGKSRLTSLKEAGFSRYVVKLIKADDKLALIMNIVENVARGSWDYVSVARSIRRLRELGATPEELERIFPWRRRWIDFIEQLQDLPQDVTEALTAQKITPTHVQLALNLPTPHEVHDGLRTAINLGWDTGTFRTYVENRVEQITRARAEARAKGIEPEIPPAAPTQLIAYKQCLICGYRKPAPEITVQLVCDTCQKVAKYVTDVIGPDEDVLNTIYAALQAYYGRPRPPGPPPPPTG